MSSIWSLRSSPTSRKAQRVIYWTEELAWVRGKNTALDLNVPVPLVAYSDRCLCHSVAMATLEKAGLEGELVFRANTAEALRSAVAAGVGVMLLPRRRIPAGLQAWDDGPLPPAPAVYGGVFVREGAANETLEQLADLFARGAASFRGAADAGGHRRKPPPRKAPATPPNRLLHSQADSA